MMAEQREDLVEELRELADYIDGTLRYPYGKDELAGDLRLIIVKVDALGGQVGVCEDWNATPGHRVTGRGTEDEPYVCVDCLQATHATLVADATECQDRAESLVCRLDARDVEVRDLTARLAKVKRRRRAYRELQQAYMRDKHLNSKWHVDMCFLRDENRELKRLHAAIQIREKK